MRIDPQIPAAENSGTNRVTDSQSGPPKNSSTAAASEPNDTVQLSSGQATVRQLLSQLASVPEVRQDRVNSLRSQIQSGQFHRSNDQVAGAVVSQLLGVNSTG
jgi:flagellar biosynthesis anti-sigma factor FlgM